MDETVAARLRPPAAAGRPGASGAPDSRAASPEAAHPVLRGYVLLEVLDLEGTRAATGSEAAARRPSPR